MNEPAPVANRETQLWYWFLYSGIMSTAQAKKSLNSWCSDGTTLESMLRSLPSGATQLSENSDRPDNLRPPQSLQEVQALRWNEDLYPKGLLQLDLQLRPALLFYRGTPILLSRPLLVIPPAPLDETTTSLLREAASLMLGETVVPAVLRDTGQANVILEELSASEGEIVLFARQGLDTITLSSVEEHLLASGRMLMLSPLAPTTCPNPRWDPTLLRVELATATKALWISTVAPCAPIVGTQTLWLSTSPPEVAPLPGLRMTREPGDVATWILDNTIAELDTTSEALDTPALPPIPPQEALRVLERGGHIPEVLRRRLLGH